MRNHLRASMFFLSYLLEHNRYLNILGVFVILSIAMLFSHNRRAINLRLVLSGLLLQCLLGFVALRTISGKAVLESIASVVRTIYMCADEGSRFLFGSLIMADGPWGFIFAVKVLPVIIFFSALMSVLFYWGIIQRLVYYVSIVVRPLLGTSGAETVCAIANSFLGQTEAPLLIRHYLANMTKSEILVVMVSGMATISGAILTVFALMGVPAVHLLTASVMAIPASIVIAKILHPCEQPSVTMNIAMEESEPTGSNIFSAIAAGTSDGLSLALNVGAMLIAFLSLMTLINIILGAGSDYVNALCTAHNISCAMPHLSLSWFFSYLFAPFGYLMGLTGQEALDAGRLLGTKITINELIAYQEMLQLPLSQRAITLLTYALCGFSNFSCIGIQIGGIGALVPEKREWLCQLGLKAVLGGSLANLLSAMITGLIL